MRLPFGCILDSRVELTLTSDEEATLVAAWRLTALSDPGLLDRERSGREVRYRYGRDVPSCMNFSPRRPGM